MTLNLIRD